MVTEKLNEAAEECGAGKALADAVKTAGGLTYSDAVCAINEYVNNGHAPGSEIDPEKVLVHLANGSPSGGTGPSGAELLSDLDATADATRDNSKEDDPFALDNLTVDGTTMEDLGIERPLLVVPVTKPNPQDFFQVHPDPAYRLTARVLELKAERETYLVTKAVWPLIPGETKLVTLLTYQSRHGGLAIWPLKQAEEGVRENSWNVSARKASELASSKWVRMQANMGNGSYDVVTSDKIPPATWPDKPLPEILRVAFGDGKLIDRPDHPVIRQLMGE